MIPHFFLLLFPLCFCHHPHEDGNKSHNTDSMPVLMISVDSLRYNLLDRIRNLRKDTPDVPSRLWEMMEKGARAEKGIQSVFPPTTFPTQHTLVTGLVPESHGVIADHLFDPILNRSANLKARDPADNWVFGGEPIWKTMDSIQVGCYMWPGCEGSGTKSIPFKWNTIWHDRVDKAIDWLKEGIRLVLVSSPDIDVIGRTDGPDSTGMDNALIRFDSDIAYLMKRMEDEGLIDRVNLIIVSGHGITKTVQEQPILPIRDPKEVIIRSRTPTMWLVESARGDQNETIAFFRSFQHLKAFEKKDIPPEWNYQRNQRISPIILLADPGYILSSPDQEDPPPKGAYGYNSSLDDMRGTLIGYGPAFLPNSSIPDSMKTVDVYQLLCILLNLPPAPNNGSTKTFHTFVHPNYLNRVSEGTGNFPLAAIIILSIILILGIIIACVLCYRSGECRGGQESESTTRTNLDTRGHLGEKMPIIHKYDSELIILELDDDGPVKA